MQTFSLRLGANYEKFIMDCSKSGQNISEFVNCIFFFIGVS